ncbi:dihydrouridine synthase-domain-containing protein [Haematococcus lacustris]
MSEMAFAKHLLNHKHKTYSVERARLVKGSTEQCFGFQVATKTIDEGVGAAQVAAAAGARWLDINVGCPIYEASRRGLGAVMLRKPRSLAKLVHGIATQSEIPVTVKIRTGESDKKINVDRVVALLARTAAAAVTVHGRTMEQRYRRPADWSRVSDVARAHPELPIIGNGDVLTHYEVQRRMRESGAWAVMTGRGALIRPWLFLEYKQGRELQLSAEERVGVYRHLVTLCKQHFGDDAKGRQKAWYFFPWHFDFLHRYRPLPEDVYGAASLEQPLLTTRTDTVDARLGETLDSLDPLERLLRCESEVCHQEVAAALWDAGSDAEAVQRLRGLAATQLLSWEEAVRSSGQATGDVSRGGGLAGRRSRGREEEEY